MQSLDNGRLGIAAQAIGIAEAALRYAAAYAAERKQFGKPIKEFQAIQFKLADIAMRVASARALLHMSATAKDRGERMTQFSAMTKLLASETAMAATTQAIQIFGGYGYVKDYPSARLFRDAKVTEIYEGTSEIQRNGTARAQSHARATRRMNAVPRLSVSVTASSSLQAKISCRRLFSRRWAHLSRTSTPKVFPESAITADASSSTRSSSSQS